MSCKSFVLATLAITFLLAVFVSGQTPSKATIIDIQTKQIFDVSVMRNQKKPHLVFYFSSSECLPCKWSILPMLEKMVKRKGDYLNLAVVDFDKVPELKDSHGVSTIPTVMTFFKGEVLDIAEGMNWKPIVQLANRAVKLVQ